MMKSSQSTYPLRLPRSVKAEVERRAEDLVTITDRNRMVGYPYPKYLNAIMEVDQSAGVLIASVKKAISGIAGK